MDNDLRRMLESWGEEAVGLFTQFRELYPELTENQRIQKVWATVNPFAME